MRCIDQHKLGLSAIFYCSFCTQQEQNALPQWYSKKTMQSYTAELCLDQAQSAHLLKSAAY